MRQVHVVFVGMGLDPQGRRPDELLSVWRDFGRVEAAVALDPGVRVTIVHAAWADEQREVHGVPCHFVRERRPLLRLPAGRRLSFPPRRLYRQVAALAPDVIHFIGLGFPRQLRGLRRALPSVPIVAQDHATKPGGPLRNRYYGWGFAVLDAATFTARAQADALKRHGVLRDDLQVFEIVEGSTPFVPGDPSAARAATGISGDPALFWLGNLDANKDPLMVLDAVARAAAQLPALRLHLCFRHAPLLAAVRERVAHDPRLAERVVLLGEVPYPGTERYLQAADFLLQASHDEGASYGVIEALACGATPLLTDIPAFRRITEDGRFGALVPIGDAAALADAIVDWSRRDRTALRAQARRHFEQALSFEVIGRQLRDVYLQLGRARSTAD
jgi:glycosyltransferase involved in cell wall biosynthesis